MSKKESKKSKKENKKENKKSKKENKKSKKENKIEKYIEKSEELRCEIQDMCGLKFMGSIIKPSNKFNISKSSFSFISNTKRFIGSYQGKITNKGVYSMITFIIKCYQKNPKHQIFIELCTCRGSIVAGQNFYRTMKDYPFINLHISCGMICDFPGLYILAAASIRTARIYSEFVFGKILNTKICQDIINVNNKKLAIILNYITKYSVDDWLSLMDGNNYIFDAITMKRIGLINII
jgi:hypothetical protein